MTTVSVVDLDELERRMEAMLRRVLDGDRDRAVTVEEAAERLGVHPRTVRRMVTRGELPAVRVGRSVRVPLAALLGSRHGKASVG